MQKWKYQTILRSRGWKGTTRGYATAGDWDLHPDSFLKELGDNGWELVAVTPRSSYLGGGGTMADYSGFTSNELWVFKRPKS